MAYTKYSLTPANNTAAPPDGAPEGMLPSAVNDTMRDMMAQIRDVGDGVRDGTYTMTAPKITGGTINGATIGATTATTGKFTAVTNSALTSGRVTYAGASGLLTDSAALTFDGSNIVVNSTTPAYFTGTSNLAQISINRSPSTGAIFNASQSAAFINIDGVSGGSSIQFATATANNTQPTERARIDASGNLGLGVTPNANEFGKNLQINQTILNDDNAGTNHLSKNAYYSSGWKYISTDFASKYTQSSGTHQWSTAASGSANAAVTFSERMRIDSSGNLLVGTTSSIGNGGVLQAKGSGPVFYLETNSSSGSQNVLDIANVSNTAYKPMRFWVNGYGTTEVGSITCTTVLTSYNQTSDYRLKENIAPMTGALAKVAQLNPVTYKWKTDGSDGQGFIAHELAEVVPDCVTGEKDAVDENGKPQYQAMDTSHLVATLVSAIKEQQALIESLTTRLTALESK